MASTRPARRSSSAAAAVLAAALLGGCAYAQAGTVPPAIDPVAAVGPAAEGAPAPDVRLDPAHDATDVAFVSSVLVHHGLTVRLAELMAEETSASPAARSIATGLLADKAPDVEVAAALLRLWGEPLPETAALALTELGQDFADATSLTREGIGLLEDQRDSEGFTPFWVLTLQSHEDALVDQARRTLRDGRSSTARRLAADLLDERRDLRAALVDVDA